MGVRSGEVGDGSLRAELQRGEPDRNQRSDQDLGGGMKRRQDGGNGLNMPKNPQSQVQMTPGPGPHHQVQQPQNSLPLLGATLRNTSSQHWGLRAYRAGWPESPSQTLGLPGLGQQPGGAQPQTWAQSWGRALWGPPAPMLHVSPRAPS